MSIPNRTPLKNEQISPTDDPRYSQSSLNSRGALNRRLHAAAKRLGLPKRTLGDAILQAGIDAIEAYNGLVLPAKFELLPRHIPGPYRRKPEKRPKEQTQSR